METRIFKEMHKDFEAQGDPHDAYLSMLPNHDLARLVESKNLSVCLDIGANIGLSTLLPSEISPNSRIFAFEPTLATFKHLVAKIGRHCQYRNVSLHQLAVGGEVGTVKFHSDETGSRTIHVIADQGHGIDVIMTTINGFDAMHSLPNIDFIKLDIEGVELSALRAANRTLVRHSPTVFIDFNE